METKVRFRPVVLGFFLVLQESPGWFTQTLEGEMPSDGYKDCECHSSPGGGDDNDGDDDEKNASLFHCLHNPVP